MILQSKPSDLKNLAEEAEALAKNILYLRNRK